MASAVSAKPASRARSSAVYPDSILRFAYLNGLHIATTCRTLWVLAVRSMISGPPVSSAAAKNCLSASPTAPKKSRAKRVFPCVAARWSTVRFRRSLAVNSAAVASGTASQAWKMLRTTFASSCSNKSSRGRSRIALQGDKP